MQYTKSRFRVDALKQCKQIYFELTFTPIHPNPCILVKLETPSANIIAETAAIENKHLIILTFRSTFMTSSKSLLAAVMRGVCWLVGKTKSESAPESSNRRQRSLYPDLAVVNRGLSPSLATVLTLHFPTVWKVYTFLNYYLSDNNPKPKEQT